MHVPGYVSAVFPLQPQGFPGSGIDAAAVFAEDPLCGSHCRGTAVRAFLAGVRGLRHCRILLAADRHRQRAQYPYHG